MHMYPVGFGGFYSARTQYKSYSPEDTHKTVNGKKVVWNPCWYI